MSRDKNKYVQLSLPPHLEAMDKRKEEQGAKETKRQRQGAKETKRQREDDAEGYVYVFQTRCMRIMVRTFS